MDRSPAGPLVIGPPAGPAGKADPVVRRSCALRGPVPIGASAWSVLRNKLDEVLKNWIRGLTNKETATEAELLKEAVEHFHRVKDNFEESAGWPDHCPEIDQECLGAIFPGYVMLHEWLKIKKDPSELICFEETNKSFFRHEPEWAGASISSPHGNLTSTYGICQQSSRLIEPRSVEPEPAVSAISRPVEPEPAVSAISRPVEPEQTVSESSTAKKGKAHKACDEYPHGHLPVTVYTCRVCRPQNP